MKIIIKNENTCIQAPQEIILKVKRSGKVISILNFLSTKFFAPIDSIKLYNSSGPLEPDCPAKLLKYPNKVFISVEFPQEYFSKAIEIIKKDNNDAFFCILLKSCDMGWCLDRLKDENGWSLLHYASLYGSSSIIKNLCVSNEKLINSVTLEGWTPLQLASFHGHASSVSSLLLFKCVDVNLLTTQGTALHKAVEACNEEVVKILLENNANVQIEDHSGKTCVELPTSDKILELIPKLSGTNIVNKTFNIEVNEYRWNANRVTSKFSQDYRCTLLVNTKTGRFYEYLFDFNRVSKSNLVYKKKIIKIKTIQNSFSPDNSNKFFFKIEFTENILKYYTENKYIRAEIVENINKITKYCKWKEIGIRPQASMTEFKIRNEQPVEPMYQNGLIPNEISLKEFEKIKVIGSGSFGTVSLVKNKYTDELFALKSSKTEKFSRVKFAILECEILRSLNYPFIIKLYWSIATKKHLNLILEYCETGDLAKAINHNECISESECRFILACIVLGLNHLHKNDIVCRDLKPSNILIDSFGYLKLCDFGLAQNRVKGDKMNAKLVGSPTYLSPEGILNYKVGKKSDIWSLGIIAYQISTGKLPFMAGNIEELYYNILNKDIVYPPNVSLASKNFIKFILQRDPKLRPNIEQVMNHEYFQFIDWEIFEKKCYESPPFLRLKTN